VNENTLVALLQVAASAHCVSGTFVK